jgi:hypothetical protein
MAHFCPERSQCEAPDCRTCPERDAYNSPYANSSALDWLGSHQNELKKYVGKWIAIHPTLGIIGSDTDLRTVADLAAGQTDTEVLIHCV